jgi:hypothetical protein
MDPEQLRTHVQTIAARSAAQHRGVTALVAAGLWPGGSQDRVERVALEWVRRWRPQSTDSEFASCSCPSGHCLICN